MLRNIFSLINILILLLLNISCEESQKVHTQNGDIQKIEYTYEDIPVLYYQNYKIIVTPEKIRVIIHNAVDEEAHIDQTYPITSSQFFKATRALGSIQMDDVDSLIHDDCNEGIRKEISYYNNHGILFKGWSVDCGQKIYGNITQYIDVLADEIRSLIPEEAHIFEKSDQIMDSLKIAGKYRDKFLTKSMYKILGMLGEYNSRFNFYTGEPITNYVEGFSSNKKELVDYFEKCIQNYTKECSIDLEYNKIDSNESIRFESSKLSKIINSFYIMIKGTATLDHKIFRDATQENMLDFCESAYRRFGDNNKNRIHMANADYKIKTLGIVLEKLGCTDIVTYYRPSIPTRFTVFFIPNQQVKARLKIEQILTKKNILPELEAEKEWEEELKKMTQKSVYFDVSQLYYDPTNTNWNIKYRSLSNSHIEISIYDIYGQRIASIVDEIYDREKHDYIPWDTSNYSSGIYFFKLRVNDTLPTTRLVKIVLIK